MDIRHPRFDSKTASSALCSVLLLAAGASNASTPYLAATDFVGGDLGQKVNAAIAALGPGGGTVYIPPGIYVFFTTIDLSPKAGDGNANVTLLGGGRNAAVLSYKGSGQAIKCRSSGITGSGSSGSVSDLTLNGPGGTTSTGIYIQSCIGMHLTRLSIQNFGGAGVELDNIAGLWTERTYIADVVANNVGPDLWFHVDRGSNSFGYTAILGAHLDNKAILVDSGATLYNSFLQFDSNSGRSNMIDIRAGGALKDCFVQINAENTSQAPESFSVNVDRGGLFSAEGMLHADYLPVRNNGTFYFFGTGNHSDPSGTSFGLYPNDQYTRAIAADDQSYPGAVLALSGSVGNSDGNAVFMLKPGPADGRSGLRILSGMTANSPQVGSIDNSGVLTLKSSVSHAKAPAGAVAITSLTAPTASSGSAGSPPGHVEGFLIINIGGTDYKVPYYRN